MRLPTWTAPLFALAREATAALYPANCALCNAPEVEDGGGCAEHRLRPILEGPRCGRCASALAPVLPDGTSCAACRADPPGYGRAACLFDYSREAGARAWILALKHGGRRDLALPLGRLLAARLALEEPSDLRRVLVPVPLHRLRGLERGYDQARLVARAAAEGAGLPCVRPILRVRATPPQGSPLSPPRAANVRGAFAARRGSRAAQEAIAGAEVWLVDDVLTSGATASECARLLRRLGAARVNVLVLARAGHGRADTPEDDTPPTDDGRGEVPTVVSSTTRQT